MILPQEQIIESRWCEAGVIIHLEISQNIYYTLGQAINSIAIKNQFFIQDKLRLYETENRTENYPRPIGDRG